MKLLISTIVAVVLPSPLHALDQTDCEERLASGTVTAVTLDEVKALPEWQSGFAGSAKDWRYYEIVNQTINVDKLKYYYLVVRNASGRVVAIQPSFLLDQDILEGSSERVRALAEKVRSILPRFLSLRTLMIGNAAGSGELFPASEEDRAEAVRILSQHLISTAKKLGARLVVFKEFPREDFSTLNDLVVNGGFSVIPSLPRTKEDLSAYATFDDFLSKQSSNRRRQIKKNMEASIGKNVELEVVTQPDDFNRLHALYEQVFNKATLSFEKLTPEYLSELSRRMPENVRYFLWKQNGKVIGMQLCLLEGNSLHTEYIGLDYSVSTDLKLFFRMHYDTIKWALENNFQHIVSTPNTYEPKRRFGQLLFPVDLYLAQTYSPMFDSLLQRIAPMMDPTHNEPELPKFPNYDELALPSRYRQDASLNR